MTAPVGDMLLYDGNTAQDLAAQCGVSRVELLGDTTSTLDVAHVLAAAGAPSGTVVVAESQSAGRGRLGREWVSAPGAGVWCTLIERPADPSALDVLSLRVGMRVAAALDALARERVRLKWPNDLMLRAGKLGGILIETRFAGDALTWVAIGIGVNVGRPDVQGAAGFPDGVSRTDVLIAVVRAARAAAERGGALSDIEAAQWTNRDVLLHRRIASPARGIVRGIDRSGALLVHTDHGTELHRAGTIRLAEDA
ncbi:MAG TPA: biotin--[acetyl-CoA-carboxylase] ligase [Gemmatimonadaceae bacterium]|nr:biotin--[acetyl-CoA-carboxylase] ligase [Gemmatimonadaceae bacterium]